MLTNLYQHRGFILRTAWRTLRARYAGSALGGLWMILLPAAQLAVYTVVFSRVMRPHLEGQLPNRFAFVLYLACGILPWTAFSRAVIHGSGALVANSRFLTKLPISEEVFIARTVVEEACNMIIYVALVVLIGLPLGHPPGPTFLLLPLVCLLFGLLAFGISLLVAPFQTFFRDVGYVLGVAMHLVFWTLPIVYVEEILPPAVKSLLPLNPPYAFIRAFRELFLLYQVPSWTTWLIMLAWIAVFLGLGSLALWKLRPDLKDVL